MPPDGNWQNVDFKTWVPNSDVLSYGYVNVVRLGLGQPWQGKKNADTYLFFALCLWFDALDCLGTFEDYLNSVKPSGS